MVKSEGFDSIIKGINGAWKSLQDDDILIILEKAGVETVDAMKQDAPVDTGRLRDGIRLEHRGKNVLIVSEAESPFTRGDYAPYVEYGGRNTQAQPYFNKNINKVFKPKAEAELKKSINKNFKK